MSVVIDLTLRTKVGHFEQALDAYLPFVSDLEHELHDLEFVLVSADPAQNSIRGVAVYESAEVAEGLTSTPYFSSLIDHLEPHLASAPERMELELVGTFVQQEDLGPEDLASAAVIEVRMPARLGHVSEVLDMHAAFTEGIAPAAPDILLALDTVQRASGEVRSFILYRSIEAATARGASEGLTSFFDAVEPLLTSPAQRSELLLLHAYTRD